MVNDWKEQLDAPLKSQSQTLITHYWLLSGIATPEHRRIKNKTKKTPCCYIAWLILLHRKREQASGFWMFWADQQAGIPSGMLVTDQSDGGMGVGAGGGWEGLGKRGQIPLKPLLLQETTEGEWLWLTMWLSGEEFGLLPDDEGLPLFLICSQVSPSALAKWSSTEPVMDTELVAVGSGSL